MKLFIGISEDDQLNNDQYYKNKSIIYSLPFVISVGISPVLPQNIKTEKEVAAYINRILSPVCNDTKCVFSKINVFIGETASDDYEPKSEQADSALLSIQSGLGNAPHDTGTTTNTQSGFNITVAVEQKLGIQLLFSTQKDIANFFEKAFKPLDDHGWNTTLVVGLMNEDEE
jgi:hypothetical protein